MRQKQAQPRDRCDVKDADGLAVSVEPDDRFGFPAVLTVEDRRTGELVEAWLSAAACRRLAGALAAIAYDDTVRSR